MREPAADEALGGVADTGVVRAPGAPNLGSAYEVIRELGRGGMAIVYLVHERATGRDLAVKVIHSKFVGDAEAIARFEREARLVARLQHPRVVRIHAVERIEGVGLALVMDRVPGHTVKQLLQQHGALPFGQVESILDDIADALEYAHGQGVVHRDVKPENIFVDETTGHALLADFGIARSMHGETNLTLAGVAIGTPTYMAPEQIDGGPPDGRSDLYSLGLVGWEMLTGQRPWHGETLYQVIYRQKHDDLPPIDTVRPDTPLPLLVAVEGLLEKSADDRWASATEFRARLRAQDSLVRRVRPAHTEAAPPLETVVVPRVRQAADAGHPVIRNTAIRTGVISAVSAAAVLALGAPIIHVWPGARRNDRQPLPAATHVAAGLVRVSEPARARATNPVGDGTVSAFGTTGGGGIPALPRDTTEHGGGSAGVSELPKVREQKPAVPPLATLTIPAPPLPAPRAPELVAPATAPVAVVPALPVVPPTVSRDALPVGIMPGIGHTCLLLTGAAYCWGSNDQHQLGTAGPSWRDAPVAVAPALRFKTLAPGLSHTCALTTHGRAYCWGNNDQGQLGDGTTTARATPTAATGGHTFRTIATGTSHTCALDDDGTVYCWGDGARGRLGDGTMRSRSAPSAAGESGPRFAALTAGWNHTCALRDDGTAYCWGANGSGALGDGTTTDRSVPTAVRTGLHFVALDAGGAHTCGITAAGTAYCWGRNTYGELGDGTTTPRPVPTPVATQTRFIGIAVGGTHTCALARDHTAWCWGRNSYGQLGDGSTTDRTRPVRVAGGHAFTTIAARGAHTCGTTTTQEMFCWGYNLDGQIGDGTREHRTRPVYVEKPSGGRDSS